MPIFSSLNEIPYTVNIRIGEEEHPIYDLGDGIQAIIILTFPLFMRKHEDYAIFIEEPEAHLHPNWQRFFMDTIVEYFPKHQFFFTTHSSTILGHESANVYSVKTAKEDDKKITTIQHISSDHTELLQELGYSSTDLFNANYIVWVEGVSDRVYIKQFIQAYDATLKEGVHYSIMFYGGCAQLEHLTMDESDDSHRIKIAKINPNFAFIVDSDSKGGKGFNLDEKKSNFKAVCTETDKICWITKVREIENLIPVDIWKQAAIAYAKDVRKNHNAVIELADVALLDEDTPNFNDRTKDTKKVVGTSVLIDGDALKINDKIKMAKQVVQLFPLTKEDLQTTPELFKNIKSIVAEIQAANSGT